MRHSHKISYIVILLLLPLTARSVDFRTSSFASVNTQSARSISEVPTTAFKSVSTGNYYQPSANTCWQTSSYSVPFAAQSISGGLTTDETSYESEGAFGPRRLPRPDYDEYDPEPIGDIPWMMMLLLAGGYIAYVTRKRKASASAS